MVYLAVGDLFVAEVISGPLYNAPNVLHPLLLLILDSQTCSLGNIKFALTSGHRPE